METDSRSVQLLCERALSGEDLSRDEIVVLLGLKDVANLECLRQAAEEGLRRWRGNTVDVLLHFPVSTYCDHNCLYCSLRRSNNNVERFRLESNRIIDFLSEFSEERLGTIVLDGAQDSGISAEFMSSLLSALPSVPVLSLGEREPAFYSIMKDCGVERYILRHKTASPILYNELHPELNFFDRHCCIRTLLDLRFQVGTSLIVGLPHQDLWDLTDDLLQIRDLGLDTVIVEPFIPGENTPLSNHPRGSVQQSLNAVAVSRLVLKSAAIPAGLSFEKLDNGSMVEALRWGADVVFCDLHGRLDSDIPSKQFLRPQRASLQARVHSMGRQISTTS